MRKEIVSSLAIASLWALSTPGMAGKLLSGDEIKALVSGKTVTVSAPKGGWKQYFAPDGSSDRDDGEKSTWSVEGDKHCNSAASLKCAQIQDNGDGTYARLKPNGSPAVTWTGFADGKQF